MIDYIIYGEFDINEGNVIKVEYPSKTGVSEMVLGSYLIPEGTHNIMNDCFCFIINRKEGFEENISTCIKNNIDSFNIHLVKYLDLKNIYNYIKDKSFKLKKLHNFNLFSNQWECLNINDNSNKENNLFIKIRHDLKDYYFNLIIYNDISDEVFYSIPIHVDIQFKKLNNCFASIYTLNSQAIGFEFFNEEDLVYIEKIFTDEKNEIMINRNDELIETYINDTNSYNNLINSEKEIYFLCYLETKLDKATKRGAILKSIAIGTTKLINTYIFKPLAKFLLDDIFKIHTFNVSDEEKQSLIRSKIELAYSNFNKIPSSYFVTTEYHRKIQSYLSGKDYIEDKIYELEIQKAKIKINISVNLYEEKIFPSNITDFILTFKENTMIILEALISDKKILFVGDSNTSCEKLSNFVFSTISIYPVFCILKRIHPYKNLYDLDFLKTNNSIYAVTNPIFKNKIDYWDLMCEVDSGKVSMSEKFKQHLNGINRDTDLFLIKEILYKIKNESINDYEIERYFRLYINHLFKLTGDEYFIDDNELTNEINRQYKRKIKLQASQAWRLENELNKMKEIIGHNGKSLKLINHHINNLLYRKNIDKEELILIYKDILRFIGNDTCLNIFLGQLVNITIDFSFLFDGLFSKHIEVCNLVKSIYLIIDNSKNGKPIMKRLNYLYMIKANSLELNEVYTIYENNL